MALSRKKKILFSFVLFMLVLLVAELAVRSYYFVKGKSAPSINRSIENEYDWATRHLKLGKPTFISLYVYDRYTGWKLAPNLKTPEVQTNSQGMRNLTKFDKVDKEKRLLFVGDSYTFGLEVNNDETFPHLLNTEHLKDWDILNMAVPGTGTDQQIITFEKRGKEYKPKIVILGFFVRDYSRNTVNFRSYGKPMFIIKDNKLELTNSPVIEPEKLFLEYKTGKRKLGAWYQCYLYLVIARSLAKTKRREITQDSYGWKVLELLMEKFQKDVKESGAVPVWLVIPNRHFVKKNNKYRPVEELCEKKCAQIGMLCLNLNEYYSKALEKQPDLLIYQKPPKTHLSPEGHKLSAKIIYNFLQENGLLMSHKK